MKNYFVFLDIDGVFTSSRVHCGFTLEKTKIWDKFDPVAVDFFNLLDDRHNIEFVLMSTWKNGLGVDDPIIYHWINSTFRNAGFRGVFPYNRWKTDPTDIISAKRGERAYEVKEYLNEHHCDDFILFDDTSYGFDRILGVKRFVKTSSTDGLLTQHMMKALSLTGLWEKKK